LRARALSESLRGPTRIQVAVHRPTTRRRCDFSGGRRGASGGAARGTPTMLPAPDPGLSKLGIRSRAGHFMAPRCSAWRRGRGDGGALGPTVRLPPPPLGLARRRAVSPFIGLGGVILGDATMGCVMRRRGVALDARSGRLGSIMPTVIRMTLATESSTGSTSRLAHSNFPIGSERPAFKLVYRLQVAACLVHFRTLDRISCIFGYPWSDPASSGMICLGTLFSNANGLQLG
jgi:hypothetical protein